MQAVPEGFTDDMTVPLPPGSTIQELVEFVVQRALKGVPDIQTERDLVQSFNMSQENAWLLRDRVFGGIVRAASKNPYNKPDRSKDPIALASFELASREPSMIASIYPQLASTTLGTVRRPWWQFWK